MVMKKLITICAVVIMMLAVSGVTQAAMKTYSIVDYPAWQLDIMTHLTDHVSGTITADPMTGVIDSASASFTITGATSSYTVASATITAPYYVVVTPTEIYLPSAAPEGFLRLSGSTGVSGVNSSAILWWYTPANPWVVGTMDWASYSGQVGSHGSGPYFASAPYDPSVEFKYYPYVVATVVPEPPPTEVWVDDDYCEGCSNDGHTWGYDAFAVIQQGINAVAPGGTIVVAAGTYVEIGQIVIDKNLTITGAGIGNTVIKKNENTGDTGSGTNRGWFLVTDGNSLTLSKVTLDGDEKQICIAILSYGTADVNACEIKNISWSAESYYGRGICLYANAGNVVRDCMFSNIRRIGVFAFGSGVGAEICGNTYTGKGVGDWLDYGVELGGGAVAEIKDGKITNCKGVASVDGSESAAVLISTYYGDGTQGTLLGNTLTGNTYGIGVGYDGNDTSVVEARYNNLSGNDEAGIDTTSNTKTVNAEKNWWGDMSGPKDPCGTMETDGKTCYDVSVILNADGLGSAVSENVSYCPWLLVPIISSVDSPCPAGDLNGDCKVDFLDLAILANNWLVGT